MRDDRAEFYKIRAEIEARLAKEQRKATIEECARVVDGYADKDKGPYGCGPYSRANLKAAAAAIRALKEK